MIVGTAGHIDHGKSTLVRALTGVDTDRLPEEKQRGISIELGYAFMDLPDAGGRIAFVDVPGHERLVHTMIAGATGMDAALLLVAADDGPMPQTREHLAVLSLLGVARGAVVVTKADRADAARVQAVVAGAQALLAGSALAGAPVFVVSATSGQGLDALRAWLGEQARHEAVAPAGGAAFRLAVDRAFTLAGVGTVVTGTVHAGHVAAGDELRLVPGDATVRVRSLHAQNQAVAQARAGQRCALALAGVAKEAVERGQWLVAPAAALATDRLDATLTLWHGEAKALRSGTPVTVHLGADAVPGTVAVLDRELLAPGETARVQLVLRRRIGAWHGDRVVLRDASATRTVAGGRVLDPCAPVRYRRTPQRLAELDALALAAPDERIAALVAAAPQGVDLQRLAAAQGRAVAPVADALTGGGWALGAAQTVQARSAVLAALAAFHAAHPDELGPDAARLRRLALPRLPDALYRALLAALIADGAVALRGAFVHLPAHGVRLSASEERIAQKAAPKLAAAGFEGAWARDLARDCGESEPLMRTTLSRLAQRGELHQVVKDLFYPPATMATLAGIVRRVAAGRGGEVTAAAFRDATALGRKRAIQILEHFDRIGLLRRVGDVHRLRSDSTLFLDEREAA
ncbi:MAG: selenocysteine-specific translation elongation factor [Rubrivivax sp.]|nr:selenocysteine-specific translation elongation factor [Rubrivivax sp.]